MQARKAAFARRAAEWTKERIGQLRAEEIEQLQLNAGVLGEDRVAALCAEVRGERPKARRQAVRAPARRGLVSRGRAFEARGVLLQDRRTSWSGVRKSDGTVVISLWADAVVSAGGGCSYLLWAPNVRGSRPWSDSDPGIVLHLAIERRGDEYWAVWGRKQR